MSVPVFEEFEPTADCACPGCARQRRDLALGLPVRAGGHPAAHGARRALVLVTAAGVVLGGGGAGAATALSRATDAPGDTAIPAPAGGAADPGPDPASVSAVGSDTPQGGRGPLHGTPGPEPQPVPAATPTTGQVATDTLRPTTRAEIINRAKLWVDARVPYSMEKYWTDGYRQDCSGYISMAWNLRANEWTGSLDRFGEKIARADLQPGDILLFHNPADPTRGSHVTIFGGWTDHTHTSYTAYEQTKPHTRKKATPMAYWENSDRYVAYRYKGVVSGDGTGAGGGETAQVPPFPGAAKFGPGKNNAYVTQLGQLLVARGGKKFYAVGPGPKWTEADRRATRAFQEAQGWRGREADGIPGPDTWELLVTGKGRSIGGSSGSGGSSAHATPFPGRGSFRPGQSNAYVEKLGEQLVKRGFGKHYLSGPGPRWTEADRRNVEAFQRAQGWRGGAADGYPGPETWRRLFR
ncbi:peptidoglycan-binding protein [Streptomyces sp. WAC08241]|uniref:peptidoglycan-binding protein n=1 Tax=Streptomyces sp. WAC08241 TaxID=2487421 RepID=UPI000F7A9318|nr:peptidoglycan-binding protein [Streptomyces sp. WAC08241]RSS35322.1 peptidoglycan-binding protein [Streptomyces sp. WAC08241]